MFSGEPDNGGKFSGFSLDISKCSVCSGETDSGDNDVLKHLENCSTCLLYLCHRPHIHHLPFSDRIVGESFLRDFIILQKCFLLLLLMFLAKNDRF